MESTTPTQLSWTLEMKEALLETLLEQCRAGKRADSGFKKEAWVEVVQKVQAVIRQSLPPTLTITQCKRKANWVRRSNYII
jgi:Myb/SANT-like DNA-binding domain